MKNVGVGADPSGQVASNHRYPPQESTSKLSGRIVTETRTEPAWIAALRHSQDRLVAVVETGNPPVTGASYCRDWTVAQVLSHLGSGAQIFSMLLDAGLAGIAPPGRESFPPIWESWNGRPPERQAQDSLAVNAALVERFEDLDDATLSELRIPLFGTDLDAAGFGKMRLSEHAIHTWDIAVMADPAATVAPEAAALIMGNLGQLAQRTARVPGQLMRIRVVTTEPDRTLLMAFNGSADIFEDTADDAKASIHLPAEALVRLVYGRLDPAHTPGGITTSGVDLDLLRRTFPGF